MVTLDDPKAVTDNKNGKSPIKDTDYSNKISNSQMSTENVNFQATKVYYPKAETELLNSLKNTTKYLNKVIDSPEWQEEQENGLKQSIAKLQALYDKLINLKTRKNVAQK